jgi:hypothetical protein
MANKRPFESMDTVTRLHKSVRLEDGRIDTLKDIYAGDGFITMTADGKGTLIMTQNRPNENGLALVKRNATQPVDSLETVTLQFTNARHYMDMHVDLAEFGIDLSSTNYELELFARMDETTGMLFGSGMLLRVPLQAKSMYDQQTDLKLEKACLDNPERQTGTYIASRYTHEDTVLDLAKSSPLFKPVRGYTIQNDKATIAFCYRKLLPQMLNDVDFTRMDLNQWNYVHRNDFVVKATKEIKKK